MVNGLYSTKRLILGRGSQRSMLGNVLFNSLKEQILECMLMVLQMIKLQGTALTRKGKAALQRFLGKLEKWADTDLMKLNTDWPGSSSADEDMGDLTDTRLNTRHLSAPRAK